MKTFLVAAFTMFALFAVEQSSAAEAVDTAGPVDAELQCRPPESCCRVCRRGCACGDSCIQCSRQCHRGEGCACNARDICE